MAVAATSFAAGTGTLSNITSGSNICAIGNNAGLNITTGTGNIYFGNNAGNDQSNESNTLRIGFSGSYIITGNTSTNILNAISITALTCTNTTNQIVLGTTNTTTLTAPAPSASRVYTIPDFGGAATISLTSNTTTSMKTGTWTPVLGDATHSFTLSIAIGTYSIIGDTVIFTTELSWTAINSASGQLQVSLPFTVTSIANYRGAAFVSYVQNVTYSGMIGVGISSSGTVATFINNPSNGAPTILSTYGATGQIQVWGFYRTA